MAVEYVREGRYKKPTRKAFFRRRPYTRDYPTKHQRKIRALLAKVAHENRDVTGTVTVIKKGREKEIPKNALLIGKKMRGVKYAPPKPKPFLAELLPFAKQVAKISQSSKSINQIISELYSKGKLPTKPSRLVAPPQEATSAQQA